MRLKFECSNSSSFDSQKEAVSKKDADSQKEVNMQKELDSKKWQTAKKSQTVKKKQEAINLPSEKSVKTVFLGQNTL